MKNKFFVLVTVVLFLQFIHTDIRLLTKAYKNFNQKSIDTVTQIDELFSANQTYLLPFDKLYMSHNSDPEKIQLYFASQYALAPKLISDKAVDNNLPKLEVEYLNDKKTYQFKIHKPQ